MRTRPEDPGKRRYYQALFNRVVSAQTEKVVEFFLEREAAEAMIGEVREDEPELAEELRVEAIRADLSAAARASFLTPFLRDAEAWQGVILSGAEKLRLFP